MVAATTPVAAREQMIEAAERIAGQRGLAAMSLREVQSMAGQKNKSAAQYHFGSRDGLIEAVLTSRMAAVGERRFELLARIDASGEPGELRDLVEALVLPVAEHTVARPGSHWARFVSQCSADPDAVAVVQRSVEGASYREVRARLTRHLTDLPDLIRARRIEHAIGLAFSSLAVAEAARDVGRVPRLPIAAQINDLIDVCVGILAQPVSDSTRAAIRGGRRQESNS